jgi:hypothetical protein
MMSPYEFVTLYNAASPEVQKAIAGILKRDKDEPLTQEIARQISIESGIDPELFEEVSEGMKAKGYW